MNRIGKVCHPYAEEQSGGAYGCELWHDTRKAARTSRL